MRIAFGLILCLLLCFSACEEPIDLVIPAGKSKLVINSNFSPDDFITVYVSEERPLLNDSTRYIADAKVRLLLNDRVIGSMIPVAPDGTYPNKPFYRSTFRPRKGRTYTLEVEVEGFPNVRAVGTAPDPIPLQSVTLDSLITSRPGLDRRETLHEVYGSITIKDQAAVKNYYHFAEIILPVDWFSILGGDTIFFLNQEHFLAPVFLLDAQDPSFFPLEHEYGFLIDDATFDGQEKTIPFRASVIFDAESAQVNRINVLFRSVSADYYRYHATYTRQLLAQESPFSEPVIVFNNVENGFGNFSGYSTTIDSVVVAR